MLHFKIARETVQKWHPGSGSGKRLSTKTSGILGTRKVYLQLSSSAMVK